MNRRFLDPLVKEWQDKGKVLLDADLAKVDRSDKAQVKAYNKRATEFNLRANTVIQHEAWLKAAPLLSLEYTRTKNARGK